MLLEHPPVYTAGKRTRPADRPTDGTPVVDVDRGGLITWHGPGQLVGYPIVALATPLDVVDYVRRLEEALIAVVAGTGPVRRRPRGRAHRASGCPPTTAAPERKVAAIGVRVQGGVTMHGFALNCDPDLTLVRPDRAVRHHRRRGDVAGRGAGAAREVDEMRAAGRRGGRRCARRSAARGRARRRPRPRARPGWTCGSTRRCSDASRAAAPPRRRSARPGRGRPGRGSAGRSG